MTDAERKILTETLPFAEHGIRGENPRVVPMREILGTTGGDGSYQTEQVSVPPAIESGQSTAPANTATFDAVIVVSGVLHHCTVNGTIGAPV